MHPTAAAVASLNWPSGDYHSCKLSRKPEKTFTHKDLQAIYPSIYPHDFLKSLYKML